jgi:hypothetical protein
MARIGFTGPTYQSQSPNVDAERCINFLPEVVESEGGKSRNALYYRPGLNAFANLGATAVLGSFACRPNGSVLDRLFSVVQSGPHQILFEVFSDGSKVNRGQLNAPTTPIVTFAHNGMQLMICTGGQIWVMPFATNVPTLATTQPGGPIQMAVYCDGFGIALKQNSNQFYVSALLDFTTWPGLSTAQVSEFPDNVVSMIVNQRQIAFLGVKASVIYQNAGAVQQPFLPVQGVFVENGCCAPFATARLDNSVFWLDLDERGQGVARRANGYTPQRISNHAVETFWNTYSTIQDAISFTYTEAGHAFWIIYFPSGVGADGAKGVGATWAYDVASQMWSEWTNWNVAKGRHEAFLGQNHAFAFGKHFVGDRQSGNLYQMGVQFLSDAGSPIVRDRITPHVSSENQWLFYHELQLDVETGLGPEPPLTGASQSPTLYVLKDAAGIAFQITMTDGPNLQIKTSTLIPGAPVINDQVGQTSWRLSIGYDRNGVPEILLTSVIFDPLALTTLPFATVSAQQTFIYVQNGRIQINGPFAAPRDPQLFLYLSRDHAHTWSVNPRILNCGQAGQFRKRVIARRMGRARTMTFKVRVSDAIPWRFVDAYLKATGADEFKPTQRLTKQLAKGA